MKTKVTVLGEEKEPETISPIEFAFSIVGEDLRRELTNTKPNQVDNIVFIRPNYGGMEYDLMYGYNSDVNTGCLYLGYFNDGIV